MRLYTQSIITTIVFLPIFLYLTEKLTINSKENKHIKRHSWENFTQAINMLSAQENFESLIHWVQKEMIEIYNTQSKAHRLKEATYVKLF